MKCKCQKEKKKTEGKYNDSLLGFVELRTLCSQDIASEHPERFFVAEIVREKIFMQYRNEVPYACQVRSCIQCLK